MDERIENAQIFAERILCLSNLLDKIDDSKNFQIIVGLIKKFSYNLKTELQSF